MLHGIYAKGGEGDVFRFGCFAKADAIPGKTFRIAAAVIYADGTHGAMVTGTVAQNVSGVRTIFGPNVERC